MNVNLIISSVALIFTPFLYILRDDKVRHLMKFKSRVEKVLYVFFLVVAYFLTRFLFMLFYYLITSFLRDNYGFSGVIVSFIVLGIDSLYWVIVGKISILKNEPLLWQALWYYFAESFVMVSLSIVIASILIGLLR